MGKHIRRTITALATVSLLLGAGFGIYAVSSGSQANGETEGTSDTTKRVPVVLTPIRQMTFEARVEVSGSVAAKRYALVSARMPGPLDAVFVDEGFRAEAGKTKLFQTDSLKLMKAVAIAQHQLAVAEHSVREKEASLEEKLADEEQTQNDLARYEKLLKHNAIPVQQFEQQRSACKQCAAQVKHSQALIALARAQVEQARLSVVMAEKDLGDSLVVAPITGFVSQRFKEPGEMASAGTPVLKIEDLSVLEVSVFLPEEYYAAIKPGETKMRIHVGGIDLGMRPVSYKSPTVHTKLRTFKVEALVQSPPAGVVPGCLAEVALIVRSETGLGVPAQAVQTRGGHSVVFVVENGQARMVEVQTGLENDGWLEVASGDLSSGAPVVSMGQNMVEQDTPVAVVKEDAR